MVFAVTAATPAPSAPVSQPTPGDGRMYTLLLCVFTLSAATAAAAASTPPPALPAAQHVPLGCVPDALVYIEQLATRRPDLRAELIAVEMRHPAGAREPHTVVIVSNRSGRTWMRDEYFGVVELPRGTPASALATVAARTLARHGEAIAKKNPSALPQRVRAHTREQRTAAALAVAEMIPDSQLFWSNGEVVAAWRRGNDYYLYHAAHGTARATVTIAAPDGSVFAAIAARLGLPVPLRAETAVAAR